MTPYFPPLIDGKWATVYYCPNCKANYGVPLIARRCLVYHPPGDCCHQGEVKLPEEKPSR